MATGFRPKLGMNLQSIVAGDQLPFPGSQMPGEMGFPGQGMGEMKPKGGFFREGGMGRTIAGLIGDALLQQADMAPVYAPAMRQRQAAEAEEAQWTRRREAERADKQWEWANKPQELPSMVRDAQAWATMTPEQQAAYKAMMAARQGDPFLATTLPNDQFYAGPRSGLPGALTGGAAAAPPRPVGKLTPISGGPTQPASGPFRP